MLLPVLALLFFVFVGLRLSTRNQPRDFQVRPFPPQVVGPPGAQWRTPVGPSVPEVRPPGLNRTAAPGSTGPSAPILLGGPRVEEKPASQILTSVDSRAREEEPPVETREYPTPETSVVFSEVCYHPPSDDPAEEWIELVNRSRSPVDLGGWRLEGGVKLSLPAGTKLEPGRQLLLAANRSRLEQVLGMPGIVGDWTGKLDDRRERVTLVSAQGTTVDVLEYQDRAPYSVLADGLGRTLERRDLHARGDLPQNWGASGVAAESPLPTWKLLRVMGIAHSQRLYLYLSGAGEVLVDDLVLKGPDGASVSSETFESQSVWAGVGNHTCEHAGEESAHGGSGALRIKATGAGSGRRAAVYRDFQEVQAGQEYSLEIWCLLPRSGLDLTCRFSTPGNNQVGLSGSTAATPGGPTSLGTPGRANSIATSRLPLLIHPVTHSPLRPGPGDKVGIRARVEAPPGRPAGPRASGEPSQGGSPVRSVRVNYEISGVERSEALLDDGDVAHGDDIAGDGVYSALLGPFSEGALALYRVTAEDAEGVAASLPLAENPTRNFGFFVGSSPAPGTIPEYQIFLSNEAAVDLDANPYSDAYRPGVFVLAGRVYPGVGIRYRGQTSRGIPKHHWKVTFPQDDPLVVSPTGRTVSTINLNSAFGDGTYLREFLSYQLWRDLGEAAPEASHVRLRLNGLELGLYLHVENPGDHFLERNGLEKGWLWKAYSDGSGGAAGFELKSGDPQAAPEVLEELLRGVQGLEGEELDQFLRERLDVPSFLTFLAACQVVHSADHVQKNYLVYCSPERKFTFLPWDLDLTHGHNFECTGGGLWSGQMRWDLWDRETRDQKLLFGTRSHPKCDGWVNVVIDAVLRKSSAFRPAYYQRVAELLAHHYHPDLLKPRIDAMVERLRLPAEVDAARWSSFLGANLDASAVELKGWVDRRYTHLAGKLKGLGQTVSPPLQSDFEADLRVGPAPLLVSFACRARGEHGELEWDFGDGESSKERDPKHVYTRTGKYTVKLTVRGPGGEHVQARRAYLHVLK